MLRDTLYGVERKRARELNNQSHIPVWLVVGFFVLFLVCVLCVQGLVCMYKCIYSLSLPLGGKKSTAKVAGPPFQTRGGPARAPTWRI